MIWQLSKRINFAIKAEKTTRIKYSAQNKTMKRTSVQVNPKQIGTVLVLLWSISVRSVEYAHRHCRKSKGESYK